MNCGQLAHSKFALWADTIDTNESNEIYFGANMRTNQTTGMELNGQRLDAPVLGRSLEMNIKLIRNAMFIMVIILVISVMGKTSAHEATSTGVIYDQAALTQLVLAR